MTVPEQHVHISEREADGTWEDCTWDSGLEWYRLAYDASRPATHGEAQKLRAASGEPATGGSNLGDLARGIKARYGVTVPPRVSGYENLRAELTPGDVAVVQGSMSAFGRTHRLSRYARDFDGSHAVCVLNIEGNLYWCDPLAPTSADVPVPVSWAEVKAFVSAFAGQHLVASITQPQTTEGDMPTLSAYTPGAIATFRAGKNVRLTPDISKPAVRKTKPDEKVAITGKAKGASASGSTDWLVWFEGGKWVYCHISNAKSIVPPAVETDCAPAISAAVTAAVGAAREAAVLEERERLRVILGL